MDTEVSDPCWCETSIHLAPVSCSFICFTRSAMLALRMNAITLLLIGFVAL